MYIFLLGQPYLCLYIQVASESDSKISHHEYAKPIQCVLQTGDKMSLRIEQQRSKFGTKPDITNKYFIAEIIKMAREDYDTHSETDYRMELNNNTY